VRKAKQKKSMVKTLIWSLVPYGAVMWTITKADIRRLVAFQVWSWRRMEKRSFSEHKTSEELSKGLERKSLDTQYKRQTKEMDRAHVERRLFY